MSQSTDVTAAKEVAFEIVTKKAEASGLIDGYFAVSLGVGNYAQVYLAKTTSTQQHLNPTSIEEFVAAKLFNDEADDDLEDVFAHEIEHLRSLGKHDHIVGLRGTDSRYPPSFICEECGLVYHRTKCPDCLADLMNGGSHRVSPSLQCRGAQPHVFFKNKPADVAKLSRERQCNHNGPSYPINFLFRPCIFLDVLDLNFDELLDLLNHGQESSTRGHRIERTHESDEDWQRQVFLIYLWSLYQAAEGLAYIHANGKLHGDLSPQNIMVSLSLSRLPYKLVYGAYPIHNTCLIDLGESRSVTDLNLTRPVRAKRHFIAQERTILQSAIPGPVSIQPDGGEFKPEGMCTLLAPREVEGDLAEGDIVRDQFGGQYIVTSKERMQQGQSCYRMRLIAIPNLTLPPLATKFQLKMDAAVRLPLDLYAFGSIAGWLLAGGQIRILQVMQTSASEASQNGECVDEEFLGRFLRPEKRDRLLKAISLPDTPEDRQIRERALLLIFRCLVRGPGAYVESRVSQDKEATVRMAKDLRELYDDFYFWHRAKPLKRQWFVDEQQRIDKISRERDELRTDIKDEQQHIDKILRERDELRADIKTEQDKLKSARRQRALLSGAFLGISILGIFIAWLRLTGSSPRGHNQTPSVDLGATVSPAAVLPSAVRDMSPEKEKSPSAQTASSPIPTNPPASPQVRSGTISSLVFSSDGKMLYSGNEEGNVLGWNIADLAANSAVSPTTIINQKSKITSLTISSDSERLLIGAISGSMLYNLKTKIQLPLASVDIAEAVFSKDDQLFALRSNDSKITIGHSQDGRVNCTFQKSDGDPIESIGVAFSEDGTLVRLIEKHTLHEITSSDCSLKNKSIPFKSEIRSISHKYIAMKSGIVLAENRRDQMVFMGEFDPLKEIQQVRLSGNKWVGMIVSASSIYGNIVNITNADDGKIRKISTKNHKIVCWAVFPGLKPWIKQMALGNHDGTITYLSGPDLNREISLAAKG